LQKFDHEKNTVLFESKNLVSKRSIRKEMGFRGDIVNRLTLVVYTKEFLRNGKKEAVVTMLTSDPRIFKLKIKVIGTEKVQVCDKKQAAYKILLDPKLGIWSVAKLFLPKMYIWNDTGPYYDWLKYVGPESTVRSPVVRIELAAKYCGNALVNRILEELNNLLQGKAKKPQAVDYSVT